MLAEEWERYFLDDLLARLAPAERDALTALAILEEPFWWEMARDLLPLPAGEGRGEGETQLLLSHFLDLSLIQHSHTDKNGDPWYTLHPVVRDYLLDRLTADGTRRALHLRAAEYYGRPFVEAARQAVAKSGQTATDEQIESLARGDPGVVGSWTHQTEDMDHARQAMNRALAWQNHLFLAGQADAAGQIVIAVYYVLARWGQRDAAKALLRRTIDSLEGFARAVAQGNLATLLKNEGRLAEALATYEQVYQTFAALDARRHMAVALGQMGSVYQDMGNYDRAIEKQSESLKIEREIGNEEGQAISLHQLSMLYQIREDYDTALQHSREAGVLARKLGNDHFLAATLHEQGVILTDLNRPPRPSSASARAWKSRAASGTSPARRTAWPNWANC